jgi:hypothetical protein
VLTRGVLVKFCIERREVNYEVEFFQAREWRQGRGDFGFGIFSGRLEWSDVAVAKASPIRAIEYSGLAMKIHEAMLLAKSFRLFVRFVISRQDEEALAERLQNRGAAFEPFTEIAEVARGDVNVGGPRNDALESAQVAVNIAEDQDFHRTFPV